jgi:hypothetical protein
MSAESIRYAAAYRWRTHKLRGRSWGYHLQRVPMRRPRPGWLLTLRARKKPPEWLHVPAFTATVMSEAVGVLNTLGTVCGTSLAFHPKRNAE